MDARKIGSNSQTKEELLLDGMELGPTTEKAEKPGVLNDPDNPNSSYEIPDNDDETLDDNIEKYADTSNLGDISQDIHNDIIQRHQEHNKQILENKEELKQNNIRHKDKRENHNYLNVKRKASFPSTKWITKKLNINQEQDTKVPTVEEEPDGGDLQLEKVQITDLHMEIDTTLSISKNYTSSNIILDNTLSIPNGSRAKEKYHDSKMVLDTAYSISNGPSKVRDQHLGGYPGHNTILVT